MTIRISLINADISENYAGIQTTYSKLPPVSSLPLIGCETRRRIKEQFGYLVDIKIFDRPVVTDSLIKCWSKSDVVGFSCWFSNYEATLAIASRLKEANKNIVIVCGGPNSTNLGKEILINRSFIDYVVVGDGEDVLWRICTSQNPELIPNLWYTNKQGELVYSFSQDICLNEIMPFDFSNNVDLDLSEYDSRISNYSFNLGRLPISTSWLRGCLKASLKNRCSFCSISHNKLRMMSPEKAWKQLEHLYYKHGISSFFESGEDITAGNYLEQLLEYKPGSLSYSLRFYACFEGLTHNKVRLLKKLGTTELFVGFESGDRDIHKRNNRYFDVTEFYSKIQLLQDEGISVCLPVIFGLPGESKLSIEKTQNVIRAAVKKFSNIRFLLLSKGMPLVGSDWYSSLVSDRSIKIQNVFSDIPDYNELLNISLKKHSDINMNTIDEAILQLKEEVADYVLVGSYGLV